MSSKKNSFLRELSRSLDLPSTIKKLSMSEDQARELLVSMMDEAPAAPGRAPRRAQRHSPEHSPRHRADNEAFRVYVDGASRGNPGPAGAGAVIAGPDGAALKRLKKFLGTATNNSAEYQALLMGLTAASEMKIRFVAVLADSELMVKQIKGEYRVKNPDLKTLHDKAQRLISSFERFSIKHVYREQNSEADAMANEAIDAHSKG